MRNRMKIIDKENNIIEDKCPSCGKDGAIIQTTEYADSKHVEVMCLNGCGHFATIIKKQPHTNEHDPCEHCSVNPKNGGSGLCNCTLACPKIT